MSFVIFDTEYTTWEGCLQKGWIDRQKKEVVQIAAIRVDDKTYEILEELNLYVKPQINPVLSDYFINLTGITNEKVRAEGVLFPEAYERFKSFVGNDKCFSHAWGLEQDEQADGKVMTDNLSLLGLRDDMPPHYANIAPWFKEQYDKQSIQIEKQCSGEIAKLLGCENEMTALGLDVHNALYDVYSVWAGMKFLQRGKRKAS